MDVVDKYLARYATCHAGLALDRGSDYEHAIVIPARDEDPACLDRVFADNPGRGHGRVLVVLVVNGSVGGPAQVGDGNRRLMDGVRRQAETVCAVGHESRAQDPGVQAWLCVYPGRDVLVIDCASVGHELPPRTGVGLARRIGADVALAAWVRGQLRSRWIHLTDADARLPPNYLSAIGVRSPQCVALSYPYWHEAVVAGVDDWPAALYEVDLHYYVRGLRWATSNYAHHTVGSTLAVDTQAYAAVRGIPNRLAGEDFYLINKLAKVGCVQPVASDPIRLSARPSARVPFGTGPAVSRIAQQLANGEAYASYDPGCFSALREVLQWIRAGEVGAPTPNAWSRELAQRLGVGDAMRSARAATTSAVAYRQRMEQWFDGLRTLRFIHLVRDQRLANVPLAQALSRAPFMPSFSITGERVQDLSRAAVTGLRKQLLREHGVSDTPNTRDSAP